jgi:hypothetical protein
VLVVTQLVEEITIRIVLNHCGGDSDVLGGEENLRKAAADYLIDFPLRDYIDRRVLRDVLLRTPGIEITYENTGLFETSEVTGGDN